MVPGVVELHESVLGGLPRPRRPLRRAAAESSVGRRLHRAVTLAPEVGGSLCESLAA